MAFPLMAVGGALGGLSSLFGGGGYDSATRQYMDQMRKYALNFAGQNWQMDPSVSGMASGGLLGMDVLTGRNPEALRQMMAPGKGALDTIYNLQQGQGLNELRKQMQLAGGSHNARSILPVGSFMSQMGGQRAQGLLGLLQQMYSNAGTAANIGGQAGQFASDFPMRMAMAKMGILSQGMGAAQPAGMNPFLGVLGGMSIGAGLQNRPQTPQNTTQQPATPPMPGYPPMPATPGTPSPTAPWFPQNPWQYAPGRNPNNMPGWP